MSLLFNMLSRLVITFLQYLWFSIRPSYPFKLECQTNDSSLRSVWNQSHLDRILGYARQCTPDRAGGWSGVVRPGPLTAGPPITTSQSLSQELIVQGPQTQWLPWSYMMAYVVGMCRSFWKQAHRMDQLLKRTVTLPHGLPKTSWRSPDEDADVRTMLRVWLIKSRLLRKQWHLTGGFWLQE